jgi:hypothetical protein
MVQLNPKTVNRWAARFMPVVLIGATGYATYVLIVRLCSTYRLLNVWNIRSMRF